MYAAPATVVAPAPRRTGLFSGGPLLAICCLCLVLFLIAATIVLALIPVYLPRSGGTLDDFGPTYSFSATYDGSLGDDGALDAQSRQNIATAIEEGGGLPSGSVLVDEAVVATTPGKRRRRESLLTRTRRGKTSRGTQSIHGRCRNRRRRCGACRFKSTRFPKTIVIFINGRRIELFVIIIIIPIPVPIPPILPPVGGSSPGPSTDVPSTPAPPTPNIG